MKRVYLAGSILGALLAGCAATTSSDMSSEATVRPKKDAGSEAQDDARAIEAKEHDLEIARARLSVAMLQEEAFARQQEAKLAHARAEVALAQASLQRFTEAEAPNRLASERLDLRGAQDRAKEAAEELEQIEIMYKDQDLDDLTAEFVVSRGRRSAERAAARIVILESELRALEERELPQEAERLRLALQKAQSALEDLEREREIGRQNKNIAVREAKNAAIKLEHELEELREEAQG